MLSKTLIIISALAASATALPVEDSMLKPRVCGIVNLPSTLVALHEADPNTQYPDTTKTDQSVTISQGFSNGQAINQVDELIVFQAPPAGSYGCTLGITFPSNYVFSTLTGVSPTLNVYSVPSPLPGSLTWNSIIPTKGSLFGTVTISAGQSTAINSESCVSAGDSLAFIFGYADWLQGAGSVGWQEYINKLDGQGLTGVYLNYNC